MVGEGDTLFCYDAFQRNGNLDRGQQLCDDLSVLYCRFFLCDQRGLAGKTDDRRNLLLFHHVSLCDIQHLSDTAGSPRAVRYGVAHSAAGYLWNLLPDTAPSAQTASGLSAAPILVTLSVLILPAYWMPDSILIENLTLFQGMFILPLSLISSVVLLHSILILADYEQKAQAAALAEMREVYYQSLQKEQTQVRTLRHDLRNHLNTVLGLLEEKETQKAQEYLAKLTDSPVLRRSRRLCDNEIVNVVLTSKCEEMERLDIGADIKISLPEQLPFADTDLCALFGNALDNAIDATKRAKNKKITLRCKVEYGMFMLLIQNPLAGDEHEDLSTTKKDKALHGFGLNGMREIVTRYGGIFDAGKKENQFELILNMPLQ